MGFIIIYHTTRVEPTGDFFYYFFTTNRDLGGWISILPKVMKEGFLLRSKKERPDPEIPATSLMFSEGSQDLNDWKECFVFIRPKMSSSTQEVCTVCNGWTLDTKRKCPNVEAIKELVSQIMSPSRDWKKIGFPTPCLAK